MGHWHIWQTTPPGCVAGIRSPSRAVMKADHWRPSTTATTCYVMRRGGVTVLVAPRMLLPYDCCGGDGAAGDSPCCVAGRGRGGVAGGVRGVVRDRGRGGRAGSVAAAGAWLPAGAAVTQRAEERVDDRGGRRGCRAGGDAAAAELLRLGRGGGAGRAAPVRGEGVR